MLFLELMKKGGPVMWIILICGLLALFIFLLKVFQFHRDEVGVRELLRGLFNVLKRDGLVEALTLCDTTPGPVARLLGAGILAHQRGDENVRSAIDEAALEEVAKLERHIPMLGTLTYIMPLLGLLGTVLGMLSVFESLSNTGSFTADVVSMPVWGALLSTAAGLAVKEPAVINIRTYFLRCTAQRAQSIQMLNENHLEQDNRIHTWTAIVCTIQRFHHIVDFIEVHCCVNFSQQMFRRHQTFGVYDFEDSSFHFSAFQHLTSPRSIVPQT